jgi:hypothetical protein
MPPGTIFISYRRDDTRADAGRLYDRLQARYPGRIFRDVGSIEPGADWTHAIEETLRTTDACLVVIGPEWLTLTDEHGRRRIDDPQDAVRKEIATALANSRIKVFPLLVGGARMPDDDDLPADLKPLARRNALSLSEQDFDAGVEKLVRALQRMPGWDPAAVSGTRRAPLLAGAAAVAAIVMVAAFYFYGSDTAPAVDDGATVAADAPDVTIALPSTGSTGTVTPAAAGSNSTAAAAGGADATPVITETSSSAAAGSLGQITLDWAGAEGTSWQVFDAAQKTALRYSTASAGTPATLDIGAGRYVIVLDRNAEIPPIPITVTGGRAVVVKPPIGQLTIDWTGAGSTSWQIYDESGKKALRSATATASSRGSIDIAPGRYTIVLDRQPEIAPLAATVAAGRETVITTPIGQITFDWDGANAVAWQVADASGRKTLRYLTSSPGQDTTTDIAPGQYLVVLGNNPEVKPIPVTVTAGKASTVTSAVGQLTFEWGGVNAVTWQVNSGTTALRYGSTGGGERSTLDIAPGAYQVVLPGNPELKPIPVTVTAGKESRVAVK